MAGFLRPDRAQPAAEELENGWLGGLEKAVGPVSLGRLRRAMVKKLKRPEDPMRPMDAQLSSACVLLFCTHMDAEIGIAWGSTEIWNPQECIIDFGDRTPIQRARAAPPESLRLVFLPWWSTETTELELVGPWDSSVASLLLVAMPGAPSSFLFLVARPGATSKRPCS